MFGLGINKLGTPRGQALTEPETLLFANDEEGTFLDFVSSQVYADTAGTDPAEVGEGIALTLDKSQGANILRRNLLAYTEEFDNAAWVKSSVTVTANAATAPDGTTTADILLSTNGYFYQGFTATANEDYVASIYLYAPVAISGLYVRFTNTSFVAIGSGAYIDVTAGWNRFSISDNVGANTSVRFVIGGVGTFPSGLEMYAWGAQIELGSTATEYQKITTGINGEWTPGTHSTQATSTARPIFARVPSSGRRNLLNYTEEFDDAVWAKSDVTVSANTITAPDGVATADTLIPNTANSVHQINRSVTTAATDYVFSVFFKDAGYGFGFLYHTQSTKGAIFNLSTGEVTTPAGVSLATASVTNIGDGWYRCSITVAATAALNNFRIYVANSSTNYIFIGDATSGIYIWGAQLEVAE